MAENPITKAFTKFATETAKLARLTQVFADATPMLPAHVQRDEDAVLGAAWRRCEAALPRAGWRFGGVIQRGQHDNRWEAIGFRFGADEVNTNDPLSILSSDTHSTPTEALTALAEALEERNAG